MKILNFILSAYLITLSILPCADIDNENYIQSGYEFASENDNHSHNEKSDTCSPFCICNCCGQITLNYVPTIIYNLQTEFEEIKTSNSIYASIFTSNFFGSIWQPPQIM